MTTPTSSELDQSIIEAITALVQNVMPKDSNLRLLGATESLSDAGVSSLNMVNLMFAIEAAFDIFIPPERVTAASFRSIESIARMVQAIEIETKASSA